MEYNTGRDRLRIRDYGRSVAMLIEYAKTLDDKSERTKAAETIVAAMARVNPKITQQVDYKHILWDHLMIMSGFTLDVDSPYAAAQDVLARASQEGGMSPETIPYKDKNLKLRHYGRNVQELIERIASYEEGEERDELTLRLAAYMKARSGNDGQDDGEIIAQLKHLSGGKITLPEGTVLPAVENVSAEPQEGQKKRRKKKKKKSANVKV